MKATPQNADLSPQTTDVQEEGESSLHPFWTAPKAGPASPDWVQLDAHLHELTCVVPETTTDLERTTILTWMYRNQGLITFSNLAERVDGDLHKTTKKKLARRALRGLVKIGAASLLVLPSNTEGSDSDSEAETDNEAESADDTELSIGKNTAAHITRDGMTWMRRAWNARYISLKTKHAYLEWVHMVYLQEEEEGKGNEPYWIERLNTPDPKNSLAPKGEISSWIGASVSSVFDLSRVVVNRLTSR